MIEDLLGGLDVTEWPRSTALPGWTVHDVVAHLIGTESRLAGDEQRPASIDVTTLAHVRNAIGAANEQWVRALRPEPPEAMLIRFHDVTRRRAESLSAISPEEFDAPTQTPVALVAFLISFVVVAIAWVGHRDLFTVIRRADRPLVWLNLLYLLPLCLVPFGAALIARYPNDAVALRLYGLMLVLIAATRIAIWLYATGNSHLLYEPPDRRFRRAGVAVAVGPAVAYLVAIVIAGVAPLGSMLIYGGVPCRLLRVRNRRPIYCPSWIGRERPDLELV